MRRAAALAALGLLACADERPRPDPDPTGRIHPPGILDETSDSFHGKELARRDYDFALCASCHGEDFSGGKAKASCLTCHEDGPTTCTTCHRDDNESASHATHRMASLACSECHTVPETWDVEGHILRGGKTDPSPAEIVFGERAGLTLDPAEREGPPAYASGTCANVYCHGDALGNAGGVATEPQWDQASAGEACNRCHGNPPPSHAQSECASCHQTTAPHIDGVVQIGRTSGCDGCHGKDGDPAPPYDLAGNQFTTALGVGAHQAHLQGLSRLRAPIACTTCHTVPASVDAPGHLDTAPPAEVVTQVGWNRATATCTNSCHGVATPVWTAEGGAACGTCHGVPPATASHATATSISTCTTCHPTVIDAFGNFLFTNGVSQHLDGDVDVN